MNCAVAECEKPAKTKGLCKRHYQQQWRTGSPEIARPNPHGSLEDRFWRHVDKGEPDACWEWQGCRDKDGYGKIRAGKANTGAHRVSWEIHNGPIPDGMLVRHRCDNPPCCNPGHHRLGDHDANMRDRKVAGHYRQGEKHHAAKFSDEVVREVLAADGTYAEISRRFGMSPSQVGNIKRGEQRA